MSPDAFNCERLLTNISKRRLASGGSISGWEEGMVQRTLSMCSVHPDRLRAMWRQRKGEEIRNIIMEELEEQMAQKERAQTQVIVTQIPAVVAAVQPAVTKTMVAPMMMEVLIPAMMMMMIKKLWKASLRHGPPTKR